MGFWRKMFSGGRFQDCLIITEDRRIVPEAHKVRKACATVDDRIEAYLLDSRNQIKNIRTNRMAQVLFETSTIPVAVRGFPNVKAGQKKIDSVGQESIDQAMVKVDRDNQKNMFSLMNRIIILVSIPCLTVLVIVAFNLWQKTH